MKAHKIRVLMGRISPPIRLFLSSPLPRARGTANILSEALGIPVSTYPGLREAGNRGDGVLLDEPLPEFLTRVRGVLRTFAHDFAGKRILAVTHGGFIMGSVRVTFDIPTPENPNRLDPDYLSLTRWLVTEHWELDCFNLPLFEDTVPGSRTS